MTASGNHAGYQLVLGGRDPAGSEAFVRLLLSAHKRQPSDHDPLDLIKADLVAPTIVELRGARQGKFRGWLAGKRPRFLARNGADRRCHNSWCH
jgi:hypothetical protein